MKYRDYDEDAEYEEARDRRAGFFDWQDREYCQTKLVRDEDGANWCSCGRCGRKLWKWIDNPTVHGVKIQNLSASEIEIKCPSCKAFNRTKI